jgi:lipooligosaccharide transport system ATP-binding protein
MVWERLRTLNREGVTMLLSTHYMEEAERLCDRLMIMDHGRIIAEGAPGELISRHVGPGVVEVFLPKDNRNELLHRCSGLVQAMERSEDKLYLFPSGQSEYRALLECLNGEKFLRRDSTLEDVFLKLTGRELRD